MIDESCAGLSGLRAQLLRAVFVELGWEPKPGESGEDREKRATAIALMGRVAAVPEVTG